MDTKDTIILGGLEVRRAWYDEFKINILGGDGFVWCGKKPLQRSIGGFKNPSCNSLGLSHASLSFCPAEFKQWRDRRFVIEATGQGLRSALLSEKLLNDHGRCFHISTTLTDEQRASIQEQSFIDACSGLPYDWGGCWSNLFKNNIPIVGNYYCSEYLFKEWDRVGYTNQKNAPRPNDVPRLAPRPCVITELILR